MRKAAIFVFMFMFLASTAVVYASVQPCKHDMSASASTTEMAFQGQALPCHQEGKTKHSGNHSQHCEGLCLCAYVSGSPFLFMKSGDGIHLAVVTRQLYTIDNITLESDGQIPLKRPPKS